MKKSQVLLTLLALVLGSKGAVRADSSTPEQRGRALYQANCIQCHGISGKGDGRVAKLYEPRPANLVASTRSDFYKSTIIRKGGAYVGRSMVMPAWEGELSAAQIADVVAFLRELSAGATSPAPAATAGR